MDWTDVNPSFFKRSGTKLRRKVFRTRKKRKINSCTFKVVPEMSKNYENCEKCSGYGDSCVCSGDQSTKPTNPAVMIELCDLFGHPKDWSVPVINFKAMDRVVRSRCYQSDWDNIHPWFCLSVEWYGCLLYAFCKHNKINALKSLLQMMEYCVSSTKFHCFEKIIKVKVKPYLKLMYNNAGDKVKQYIIGEVMKYPDMNFTFDKE